MNEPINDAVGTARKLQVTTAGLSKSAQISEQITQKTDKNKPMS